MRILAVVMVVACSSKPSQPDPADFARMTPQQKCDATAAKGEHCLGYILTAQVEALDKELAKEIGAEVKMPSDKDRTAYLTMCEMEPTLADAVMACWSHEACKAFATCVVGHNQNPK